MIVFFIDVHVHRFWAHAFIYCSSANRNLLQVNGEKMGVGMAGDKKTAKRAVVVETMGIMGLSYGECCVYAFELFVVETPVSLVEGTSFTRSEKRDTVATALERVAKRKGAEIYWNVQCSGPAHEASWTAVCIGRSSFCK